LAVCALGLGAGGSAEQTIPHNPCGPGIFVAVRHAKEPVLTWLGARSYGPDTTATLWVRADASSATVRIYHILAPHWSFAIRVRSTFRPLLGDQKREPVSQHVDRNLALVRGINVHPAAPEERAMPL
jgi:hypothetical protein